MGLVQVRDVSFDCYFPPQEKCEEPLFMSFRVGDMKNDEMSIDIQRDEKGFLFSTSVGYFSAHNQEEFWITEQFDEEELLELLKAVLMDEATKLELEEYGWIHYNGFYVNMEK